MCEYRCQSPTPQKTFRKLSLLLLDCWQREYDRRPYRHFKFERLMFEQRLDRNYDPRQDFNSIVLFLMKRTLCSIKLVGLPLISNAANDVATIANFVQGLQKLQYIELKLMDLPTVFFQLLVDNVKGMQVKELSLEGTVLNDKDLDYLHEFIVGSTTLTKLNVASCSLNQYNFAQVADAIHKSQILNSCNISHLLGLHLTLDSNKVAHIVASLIWQNKLQEMILEHCGFIGHDMEIIAEYLQRKCCKLQTLNVSYNKIGSNGALELFKGIARSGTLKHLKINGCSLATHGGEVVAQYLSSCWNLESLELQRNSIGAEAINMILLCMKKHCKLQNIHLFGNSFNARTGATLNRLLDSKVLLQENIDITVTFDTVISHYRVIPWLP